MNRMTTLGQYEQEVLKGIIDIYDSVRYNKERNCSSVQQACNYKNPSELFRQTIQMIDAMLSEMNKTSTPSEMNKLTYVLLLERYNQLVTYTLQVNESEYVPPITMVQKVKTQTTKVVQSAQRQGIVPDWIQSFFE
jgi:hypothetical protein